MSEEVDSNFIVLLIIVNPEIRLAFFRPSSSSQYLLSGGIAGSIRHKIETYFELGFEREIRGKKQPGTQIERALVSEAGARRILSR